MFRVSRLSAKVEAGSASGSAAAWATLAVWVGLSTALFFLDRTPLLFVGAVVQVRTTLVAADAVDAMCGSDAPFAGHYCRLTSAGSPRKGGSPDDLFPCMTPERQLLLIAGLYRQRVVAERVAAEAAIPRSRQKRFALECQGDVQAKAPGVRVRWLASARLGNPAPAWVIVPSRCSVR
jgi:hypothetical protein